MPVPMPDGFPTFAELPVRPDAPPNSAWGVFGNDDQVGTFNFQSPERVLEAVKLVRTGQLFPLNWSLLKPSPPLFGRQPLKHRLGAWKDRMVVDDVLHNFYPQVSSQWDALRHAGHVEYGFYNGFSIEEASQREGGPLGIDNWARRGIAGRGVLLDVHRYMERTGRPFDGMDGFMITRDHFVETARDQGVEFRPGDILLVRTGWMQAYEKLTPDERQDLTERSLRGSARGGFRQSGIGGNELPPFLWDNRIAAVAADNPAFDVAPRPTDGSQSMHGAMIGLLGMPIGEMWFLDDLAAACDGDHIYEFFLTSAPLNMPGGAGSPPNALAIK